ncbi:acyl-CoA desaturase [Paenarthrobacter sp. Z7-10]|uniref:fatty acid desaturase family protein n=1 Tax=Paenarthrobacter sp. Z7-10 TaxID=2787635 RepID=UPI0022A9F447|nr:acyl-CoA desaturase [Paenarthrobacter sp. Z7-10]MCZ2403137.1 acyl-CoA desaturase [Paenarthrobacter sp. Z7-10]
MDNHPFALEVSSAAKPRSAVVRRSSPTSNPLIASYSTLLKTVRSDGLLRRHRRYYMILFAVLMLLFGAAWTGFGFLGESWSQLFIAAALGALCTQFGFLAHEAAHGQIFSTKGANEWFARLIGTGLTGISYAMWVQKHTKHHVYPNTVDKDPDIKTGTVAFYPGGAASRRGAMVFFTRRQGYFLFPLLLLLGLALYGRSVRFLLSREKVDHRWVEIPVLMGRYACFLAIVFWFLPLGMAFAFIGVQVAVFGFYMGASFAPNHKGMPVLDASSRVDFLSRQVLTSRNIAGGRFMDVLMGGLNRQIEHHLFPDMARPHLHRAATLVRQHCRSHAIPYTETNLIASYAIVVRYLNTVGLSAGSSFECPVGDRYRPW